MDHSENSEFKCPTPSNASRVMEKENTLPILQGLNDEIGEDEEQWINASDFANAVTPTDWDVLVSRGGGTHTVNRWDRNSLFQKFDPLVSRRSSVGPANVSMRTTTAESIAEQNETDSFTVNFGSLIEPADVDQSYVSTLDTSLASTQHYFTANSSIPTSPGDVLIKTQEDHELALKEEANQQILKEKDEIIRSLSETVMKMQEAYRLRTEQENEIVNAAEQKLLNVIEEKEKLDVELENSKQSKHDLTMESQMAKEDLNDMESAFAEALLVYESVKMYRKHFETNEKVFKAREPHLTKALEIQEQKLTVIKKKLEDATEKLQKEEEARLKEAEIENKKLRAKLRMAEMKSGNLEAEIKQTEVEIVKLRALCDEMIRS